MAMQRKRFRVEKIQSGELPIIAHDEEDTDHGHYEIMSELRAIRAQIAAPSVSSPSLQPAAPATKEEAMEIVESYRAQIEQCDKLKIELDLIHEAINRTKQEIAMLHGKSFEGDGMTKVTGELGAVVGGTEEATQQILAAAESIDQAAAALAKPTSADQQQRLSEEIQDSVVGIFEACNFQDLTGQRINKVMTTMKFIEHHINAMMDIWGGVDAIKAHAPAPIDHRSEEEKLLNGPKGMNDEGHVSQNDIDALFP